MRTTLISAFILLLAATDDPSQREADQKALGPLQAYIGGWRGVGQVRRGSNKGAWTEEADWAWKFQNQRACLSFNSPNGKYFHNGRIATTDKPGEFVWIGTLADGKTVVRYRGTLDKGNLVLTAEEERANLPARISVRTVANGDRLVVLYERRLGDGDRFLRLSEVGYTRKGSGFGGGSSYPECVVTGGHSTMTVEYKGQKYPVCCSGCRDLFVEDPEGVLAEYRTRKAVEKAKSDK